MCGGPDALRRGWWVTRETLRAKGHPGLYLRSLGGESSAWPRGEGFPPEPKSPSSGSTSSSKMVSRGAALGFTATAGHFLGFLELENHRQNSRLGPLTRALLAQRHPGQTHTGVGQAGVCVKEDLAKTLTMRG